jgi:hypothetical protein
VVIPETVIASLADAIETVIKNEARILGPARAPGFDIHKLEAAWADFEAHRT